MPCVLISTEQLSSDLFVFHFGCCRLLLFVFGIFGVLPKFSDITYAVTYCGRLMLLRLSTSSAIISWIAWFISVINSSVFLFIIVIIIIVVVVVIVVLVVLVALVALVALVVVVVIIIAIAGLPSYLLQRRRKATRLPCPGSGLGCPLRC